MDRRVLHCIRQRGSFCTRPDDPYEYTQSRYSYDSVCMLVHRSFRQVCKLLAISHSLANSWVT